MIFNVVEYCSCKMIEFGRRGSSWSRFKKIKIFGVSLISQKNSLEGFLNIKNQKINNCFLRHCNLEIFYNLMQTSKKCYEMVDRDIVWMEKLCDLCSKDPEMLRNDFLFQSFVQSILKSFQGISKQMGVEINFDEKNIIELIKAYKGGEIPEKFSEEDLKIKEKEKDISDLKKAMDCMDEIRKLSKEISKNNQLLLQPFENSYSIFSKKVETSKELPIEKNRVIKKKNSIEKNRVIKKKNSNFGLKNITQKVLEELKKNVEENPHLIIKNVKVLKEIPIENNRVIKGPFENGNFTQQKIVKKLSSKVIKEVVRRNLHFIVENIKDLKKLTKNVRTVVLKSRDEKITFTLKLNKNGEIIVVGPLAKLFNFGKRYSTYFGNIMESEKPEKEFREIVTLYAFNNEWNFNLNIKRFSNLKTLVYTVKGMSFESLFSNTLFFIPPLKKLETLCLTNINTNPKASKYSPCSKSFLEMSFFKNIEKFFEDFPKLQKLYLPANPLLDSPALENLKNQQNIEIGMDEEKQIISLTHNEREMKVFLILNQENLRKDFMYIP